MLLHWHLCHSFPIVPSPRAAVLTKEFSCFYCKSQRNSFRIIDRLFTADKKRLKAVRCGWGRFTHCQVSGPTMLYYVPLGRRFSTVPAPTGMVYIPRVLSDHGIMTSQFTGNNYS